jgi:hypothetical protein
LADRQASASFVHVRPDQARIDRKSLAANQASGNALRHDVLKYPA